MIQIDTNFLVALVAPREDAFRLTESWLKEQKQIAISAITWSEFCNGPLLEDSKTIALDLIQDRIIDFSKKQAELAAELFNETGRRRSSRCDCMIAASAIVRQASLATYNQKDFERFIPHGLQLVDLHNN